MIVREDAPGLLLITQPDHAALAARLMAAWAPLSGAVRRDEILLAIAEHDNGWREPDAAPIVDAQGRVLDFVHAPDNVRQAVWPRGIERLAATPYAAALVAEHAKHIYQRYESNAAWTPFFEDVRRRRAHHLARAGHADAELAADYAFVRIGDLLSLVFCNLWRDEEAHAGYRIRLGDVSTLVVSPDPFGGREIPFEIAARRLPARAFASADAARAVFEGAPVELLRGTAVGA